MVSLLTYSLIGQPSKTTGGMMADKKELSREATKFLRTNGFMAGGQRKSFSKKQGEKRARQKNFERPFISVPVGGQPGYKIRKRPK